jgi:hypothetical protein
MQQNPSLRVTLPFEVADDLIWPKHRKRI